MQPALRSQNPPRRRGPSKGLLTSITPALRRQVFPTRKFTTVNDDAAKLTVRFEPSVGRERQRVEVVRAPEPRGMRFERKSCAHAIRTLQRAARGAAT